MGQWYDWAPGTLGPACRALDQRLRTHAAAGEPEPITFLAVGDFGVGIANGDNGKRQLDVARTMQRLADAVDVRFIVGLGDSVYHGPAGPEGHSGTFDEDWWLTFFQPYRYLIDHLAFYPTAGNHDGSDEESSDDRQQLEDNNGVRLLLHGHEHNFQHGQVDGLHYVVSSAGGKLDERAPTRFNEAGTVSWAAVPHCLLVQVTQDRLIITPYGATPRGGQPQPILRRGVDGTVTDKPIIIPTN